MLIYRHWAIMVNKEKLLNIIALMKCEDHRLSSALQPKSREKLGIKFEKSSEKVGIIGVKK